MVELQEWQRQKTWIQANKNANKMAQSTPTNADQIRVRWNNTVDYSYCPQYGCTRDELFDQSGLGDYKDNDGLPPAGKYLNYMQIKPWT